MCNRAEMISPIDGTRKIGWAAHCCRLGGNLHGVDGVGLLHAASLRARNLRGRDEIICIGWAPNTRLLISAFRRGSATFRRAFGRGRLKPVQ